MGLIIVFGLFIDNVIVIVDEVNEVLWCGENLFSVVGVSVWYLVIFFFGLILIMVFVFVFIVIMFGLVGEFVGFIVISVILVIVSFFLLVMIVILVLVVIVVGCVCWVEVMN